jgi:Low-density lipoprotein receptor repeat class B
MPSTHQRRRPSALLAISITAVTILMLAFAPRAGAFVYWANFDDGGGGTSVARAGLDGSGLNTTFVRGGSPDVCGVAVDAAHLYWTNLENGTIGRANLDGSGVNQRLIAAPIPSGVAVDAAHIYWTNLDSGTVGRANLDGTGVNQTFISGGNQPEGVAVDAAHIYWANNFIGPTGFDDDAIGRANLDGSGVNQQFITGRITSPFGVAVDAADAGYPRPKSASPIRVSLVPAFNPCVAANRTHGAPLAFPSCAPPVQSSGFATVGTPDANGAAANSVGSTRLTAVTGDPATVADEADVTISASTTDVRLKAGLGDYTGQLQANVRLRLTDHVSGPGLNEAATVQDFPFTFTVPCQTTADTTIGSSCAVATSADAIQPGTVREKARTIWQLGDVELFDGGPDGVAATTQGNTLFEAQGVFVP